MESESGTYVTSEGYGRSDLSRQAPAPNGAEGAQFSAPEAPGEKRLTEPSNDC